MAFPQNPLVRIHALVLAFATVSAMAPGWAFGGTGGGSGEIDAGGDGGRGGGSGETEE
jgi:hypothetical protein